VTRGGADLLPLPARARRGLRRYRCKTVAVPGQVRSACPPKSHHTRVVPEPERDVTKSSFVIFLLGPKLFGVGSGRSEETMREADFERLTIRAHFS
jgi:hypothetical protein